MSENTTHPSKSKPRFLGQNPLAENLKSVEGDFLRFSDDEFYRIKNFDQMPPFFMSIVSSSDHWMYLSSLGSLSAGRRNPQSSLFPYYTVDKIHDNHDKCGSQTMLQVHTEDRISFWQPFSVAYQGIYKIERNLYKNVTGNKVLFEEINHDLGLSFTYSWTNSERYGFVKQSKISNLGTKKVKCEVVDGIGNVLPYGVDVATQNHVSCLVDAYKKNELLEDGPLALYTMSAILVDKAEPAESLKATTIWGHGLDEASILLSDKQLDGFKFGKALTTEHETKATRGSYYLSATIELEAQSSKDWGIVAELNQSPSQVSNLQSSLREGAQALFENVLKDIEDSQEKLVDIVGSADGLQLSGDQKTVAHHFANVLFNVMRGGTFIDSYNIPTKDFVGFVESFNKKAMLKHKSLLESLPETMNYQNLLAQLENIEDPDLHRIALEYLPLTFSRRHGDPSRPWNQFSINVKDDKGEPTLDFQGNWRDVFQNWEALCQSFPEYIEGTIAKFVNASTADGFNPYRITKQGIDWEEPDPEDPWANIGYWGDHQINYLIKLLEGSAKHHPQALKGFMSKEIFGYANVPYEITTYEKMLVDSQDTIHFNETKNKEISQAVDSIGADGKLLFVKGEVYRVNLLEKLLVPLISKMLGFVPGGGIWMNTQRPEWNDANNALVGAGLSMVTTCYVRRYLEFMLQMLDQLSQSTSGISISSEVHKVLSSLNQVLASHKVSICDDPKARRSMMDQLGLAGDAYRQSLYKNGLSGEKELVPFEELKGFFQTSLEHIDETIRQNRREDGLYHSYNLLSFSEEASTVSYLYEMLEGQVAVLSSGLLTPEESLEVIEALRNSRMYREDQHTYMLYPNRQLPLFLNRSLIPDGALASSKLVSRLLEEKDGSVVERDNDGQLFFSGPLKNAADLNGSLDKLSMNESLAPLVQEDRHLLLKVFEEVFDHKSFTGRSGTFFAYEGLGSIYWHMVSKLLLAVQENFVKAAHKDPQSELTKKLADAYYDVRAGIGFNKTPDVYGAFPTDPYSHTPWGAGAKQPGMTGQVKEEVLTRLVELGVFVENGTILFNPVLLKPDEFLTTPKTFSYTDLHGQKVDSNLEAGSLAFTYCNILVILHKASDNRIVIHQSDGKTSEVIGSKLNEADSHAIFSRDGRIKQIDVYTNVHA